MRAWSSKALSLEPAGLLEVSAENSGSLWGSGIVVPVLYSEMIARAILSARLYSVLGDT